MLKIVQRSKLYFAIAAVLIIIGIVGYVINGGFTLSTDFAGGLSMYVDMGKEVDLDEVAQIVQENTPNDVQPSVLRSDGYQVVIRTITLEKSEIETVQEALIEKYGIAPEAFVQIDNVSATVGKELTSQAIKATVIAAILMLLYITIRFEFKTAVSAIICLLHDVAIMLSFYAVFRIPVDTNLIAAILTIIGYSINNTIVIFDRIRENYGRAKRAPFEETVNRSIKQTLGRSINTTITTLLPVLMLCILGVVSIKTFAVTLLVGLLAGTYSSVFLAGSIWAWLKGIQDNLKRKRSAR